MSFRKQTLMVFLVVTLLLSACAVPSDLAQNRQKWAEQPVSHYRFNLWIACFCAFRSQMPLQVEVKDGQIVSMTAADGSLIREDSRAIFEKAATMEGLFDLIESAQQDGADRIDVQYDPQYGFPLQIDIDQIEQAADDEISYMVENFQELE